MSAASGIGKEEGRVGVAIRAAEKSAANFNRDDAKRVFASGEIKAGVAPSTMRIDVDGIRKRFPQL
jgi:hypothetical protein